MALICSLPAAVLHSSKTLLKNKQMEIAKLQRIVLFDVVHVFTVILNFSLGMFSKIYYVIFTSFLRKKKNLFLQYFEIFTRLK